MVSHSFLFQQINQEQYTLTNNFDDIKLFLQIITESLKYCYSVENKVSQSPTLLFSIKIFTPELFEEFNTLVKHKSCKSLHLTKVLVCHFYEYFITLQFYNSLTPISFTIPFHKTHKYSYLVL
ncbi:hypothetical protein ENUP19_0083G0031 [Entamoeba nuttalli]|uniref:Uncharacterized protein n=1 Tax=Entamoeba nuttalli TaxID=412467 RepID=A0ABQ0DFQ3_9EUKA